jgi:energy-coupling factor transporter ATP-binding protein EcfA2
MDDNDLQQEEPVLPLRGWWKRNLFLNTMQAGGFDNTPSPCKWADDPDLDWFTYFMASAVWNRFVHWFLDPDRAARVAFATVSQGRFGLRYGELLASVRIDDADAQDRPFLIALEAALREHNEEDISSLDREIGLVFEAMRHFDVTGVETEDLLGDPWAPVPLFTTGIHIGSGGSGLGLLSVVSELGDPIDLDRESASSLLAFVHDETMEANLRMTVNFGSKGLWSPTPTMDNVDAIETYGRGWLDKVPELANRTFSNLLTDAPLLRLDVRPAHDWFQGRPPLRWWVQDQSGTPVDLQDLSTAQKRWSTLAIRLALDSIEYAHSLLVLDEPEAALHPSAQRFLAQGIKDLGSSLQVIVASHSPAFLDQTIFRLHHVHRGRTGKTELSSLAGDQLQAVSQLGIAPSELLQHIRLVVVVEGRHDEIILRTVIGADFDGIGAIVVPMGGAAKLSPVLDSRLIFDYTDAKVLVVLDNSGDEVRSVWEQAMAASRAGDLASARETLLGLKRDGERGFLRNFGLRAVEQGQTDRVEVFGLTHPDILDYLSPSAVVPKSGGRDWNRLRSESGAKTGTAFKNWLRDTLDFDDEDSVLELAARRTGSPPPGPRPGRSGRACRAQPPTGSRWPCSAEW